MSGLRVAQAHDGAQLRLILDRPKGNVVTGAMIGELRSALASIGPNAGVKLITLEGAGPNFSYGASVEEHVADRIAGVLADLNRAVLDLLRAPAPTLAVVRGRCLGGGFELVLACDMVFAADDALLGVPEVALGVFPPAAASLLPLRVGTSRASRAVIGGEILPAAWWMGAGLVDRVVAPDFLEREVDGWFSTQLAPRSAAALAHAAEASRAGLLRVVPGLLGDLERQDPGSLDADARRVRRHRGFHGASATPMDERMKSVGRMLEDHYFPEYAAEYFTAADDEALLGRMDTEDRARGIERAKYERMVVEYEALVLKC